MKNLIKLSISFIFLITINLPASSQDEEFIYKGKFFISPDLGLMFGTITMIDVSSALGYYINDRLSVAGGFIYEYYKQSYSYAPTYETSIYGPRAYTRFTVVKNLSNILPVQSNTEIFAHLEYESLSLENEYFGLYPDETSRFWYHTALVGGGISQNSSPRIKFNFTVLWDMDTSSRSPYSNPLIRVGIQILLGKIDSGY